MSDLFSQLKRRSVFRVGAVYIITGWVIAQVGDLAADNFGAPEWVMKMFMVFLMLGFPVALILAWAFELTPDGIKRDRDGGLGEMPPRSHTIDYLVIGAALLAVAYTAWTRYFPVEQIQPTVAAIPVDLSAGESGKDKSIAVLPFANMSDDPSNTYFSDGLSEMLLHLLAQVPELRVAARTSSFQFKGQQQDIREIGQALNVGTVLEGSVQKVGDRVRITAQLINTDDGYHLWSETYDRTLEDVFAVQDEIASSVADALKLTLDVAQMADKDGGTDDVEAYDSFLKGMEAMHGNTDEDLAESLRHLHMAVNQDPDFALAWAQLARAHMNDARQGVGRWRELAPAALATAQYAVELAPEMAEGYSTLGLVWWRAFRDMPRAEAALSQALKLNPSDSVAWNEYSNLLWAQAKAYDALRAGERARELNPLDTEAIADLTFKYLTTNEVDKARAIADFLLDQGEDENNALSAFANIGFRTGDYAEAVEAYLRMLDANPESTNVMWRLVAMYTHLEDFEMAEKYLLAWESFAPEAARRSRMDWCEARGDTLCMNAALNSILEGDSNPAFRPSWIARRHYEDGDIEAAVREQEQQVAERTEAGDRLGLRGSRMWLSLYYDRAGMTDERDALLDVVEQSLREDAENGFMHYYTYADFAEVRALRGDVEGVVENLDIAIQHGFRNIPQLENGPWFEALDDEPEMQELIARLRADNQRAREEIRERVGE